MLDPNPSLHSNDCGQVCDLAKDVRLHERLVHLSLDPRNEIWRAHEHENGKRRDSCVLRGLSTWNLIPQPRSAAAR